MNKKIFFNNFPNQTGFICAVVLLIGFAFSVVGQNNKILAFKTVVIDAGHGGKDPGAVGKIVKEKDVVLPIALKVGEYITKEMPGVKVIYTRSTDVFVPLDERAEIANRNKADLFVSIHANSISNPKISGAETFVLGLHRSQDNLEVAKKENSVIVLEDDYNTKYEGFDPNSTESYIIFELMQNVYLDQSIDMASLVQDQFEKRVGRNNRGVKQAGFLVLRQTAMPGILVEVGFLSNRNEEKFMASSEGQDFLASAIFRSVRDYKTRFEARNGISNATVNLERPVATSNTESSAGSKVNEDLMQTGKATDLVEFRIQIASSGQKIKENSGPYADFKDIWVYQEGNLYKYTTGLTNSYSEIVELLNAVRAKVPDGFIVAFKNGKKVPISSVR